jgi:formimidoylglutamate deiminase
MVNGLLESATASGYRALGMSGGRLAVGEAADFFTADLKDLSILGADAESLAQQALFAMAKSAVRDVAVAGKLILQDGRHAAEDRIAERYLDVQRRYNETQGSGELR